ncbi:MAG TPA: FadR/GntR family transcriptional regulator [Terriglobales bacterium]|nr:FadR/GntR family transcriptional regulator [Terriglobales bacterium]
MSTPTTEFAAISRKKVYAEVARQLERRILEELKPGDMLPPERELAQVFGVSRSSIRDAIRRLEAVGLVRPRQGAGTVVCEPSESLTNPLAGVLHQKRRMITELLDVRKIVEPALAARAAVHASPEQLAQLESIVSRHRQKVQQGESGIEEDSEFHYTIALASDNSVVLKVVDVLMDLLRETRERSLQVEGRQAKSLAGHQRILTALKRRNPQAAESAMRRHLEEIEEIVLRKL